MSVGYPAWFYFEVFGQTIRPLFGHRIYHVGSSLEKKREWFDVDVVVLLSLEEWKAFDLGCLDNPNAKHELMCAAFSELGRKMTGLPIDFKIQEINSANEKFKDRPRSALGLSLE
jgi:hypothetical protein